uniref:EF-hand domain-containing protein n=1 Tax=Parastrongyloides trichosuri TaxID=131310 RepID=A0A0N5A2Z9_PARTI
MYVILVTIISLGLIHCYDSFLLQNCYNLSCPPEDEQLFFLREIFNILDVNGDNETDFDEIYSKQLKPLNIKDPNTIVNGKKYGDVFKSLLEWMETMDMNKDGKVTWGELVSKQKDIFKYIKIKGGPSTLGDYVYTEDEKYEIEPYLTKYLLLFGNNGENLIINDSFCDHFKENNNLLCHPEIKDNDKFILTLSTFKKYVSLVDKNNDSIVTFCEFYDYEKMNKNNNDELKAFVIINEITKNSIPRMNNTKMHYEL